jgi:hypothetical protein
MIAHREEDLNDFYDKISSTRQGKDFQAEPRRPAARENVPKAKKNLAQDTAHFPESQDVHLPSRSELVNFLNHTYDTMDENVRGINRYIHLLILN